MKWIIDTTSDGVPTKEKQGYTAQDISDLAALYEDMEAEELDALEREANAQRKP